MELKVIAKIHTDYKEKFGIPRQSGIASESLGKIIFENKMTESELIDMAKRNGMDLRRYQK